MIRAAGTVMLAILFPVLVWADGPWSVEQLNSHKKDWERLSGTSLRVEGRVGSASKIHFRLLKCDLLMMADISVIEDIRSYSGVEVTGTIKKDPKNGTLYFEVKSARRTLSDGDEFERRLAALKSGAVDEAYELGEWAVRRGNYYEDNDLVRLAAKAYTKGLMAAFEKLSDGDDVGRMDLAARAKAYRLPTRTQLEFIHSAWRIRGKRNLAKNLPDLEWDGFLIELDQSLPGSSVPLTVPSEELARRYEKDAVAAYRDASDEQRRALHRLLRIDLDEKKIMTAFSEDGRNGDKIAARIRERIPERESLAVACHAKSLNFRSERFKGLTLSEIKALRDELTAVGRASDAKKVVEDWLAARITRLKGDGAQGLVQIADELLELSGDRALAINYLIEADRSDPAGHPAARERLIKLGMTLRGKSWVVGQDPSMPSPVEKPLPDAPEVGMTSEDVHRIMGAPSSVARVMSSGRIAEVWAYGQRSGSRLLIEFRRGEGDSALKVTRLVTR